MYDARKILVWKKIFFLAAKTQRNDETQSFFTKKPRKIGALLSEP